jgi:hypothetical protein
MPDHKVSRRELAIAVAAAVPALAQTAAPQQPTSTSEDLDAAAREQVRRYGELLRKTELPVLLEPSFIFRP